MWSRSAWKPVSRSQRRGQLVEMCFVQGRDLAALTANQMMMPVRSEPLEQVVAGAEVGLGDQAHLLRRCQGSIHGGGVDVGIGVSRRFEQLGGGDVALGVAQAAEDDQALWRHLLPGSAQDRGGIGLAAHELAPTTLRHYARRIGAVQREDRRRGLSDDQHGGVRVAHELLGGAAEQVVARRRRLARTDDDQVAAALTGDAIELGPSRAVHDLGLDAAP